MVSVIGPRSTSINRVQNGPVNLRRMRGWSVPSRLELPYIAGLSSVDPTNPGAFDDGTPLTHGLILESSVLIIIEQQRECMDHGSESPLIRRLGTLLGNLRSLSSTKLPGAA